ncbi:MAG: hypothetical protein Solumvirus1_15 [Solumvirus sp.]|uniref:Uncharacterized protein n=1 Tax=Solumvirus sp. TaxID=2487773 RepID=A0A3G5AG26_9VIRU|nr:MAG: hypothetical protein Solumvirus1_15 [Solumvirus sp.]
MSLSIKMMNDILGAELSPRATSRNTIQSISLCASSQVKEEPSNTFFAINLSIPDKCKGYSCDNYACYKDGYCREHKSLQDSKKDEFTKLVEQVQTEYHDYIFKMSNDVKFTATAWERCRKPQLHVKSQSIPKSKPISALEKSLLDIFLPKTR